VCVQVTLGAVMYQETPLDAGESRCKAPRCSLKPEPLQATTAPEPLADDLNLCQGVVLSRAASILRSIEAHPMTVGSTLYLNICMLR
jgi:hypothetical protein